MKKCVNSTLIFLHPFHRFTENLKYLREAVKNEKDIIVADERDHLHDQIYFQDRKISPEEFMFGKPILKTHFYDFLTGINKGKEWYR